jgi:hypothetical protein
MAGAVGGRGSPPGCGSATAAENDPAEQEKAVKFNSLLANCVIFHTALDMTEVIRQRSSPKAET